MYVGKIRQSIIFSCKNEGVGIHLAEQTSENIKEVVFTAWLFCT
jgi:hypothetical protein